MPGLKLIEQSIFITAAKFTALFKEEEGHTLNSYMSITEIVASKIKHAVKLFMNLSLIVLLLFH